VFILLVKLFALISFRSLKKYLHILTTGFNKLLQNPMKTVKEIKFLKLLQVQVVKFVFIWYLPYSRKLALVGKLFIQVKY